MPKTLMFARLTGNDSLTDDSKPAYLHHSSEELAKLFTRIDVPNIGNKGASIPDVWAQPIRFQQALLHGDESATAQWRGLLALYILRKELGLEGKLELVPVFQEDGQQEPTDFLNVASHLLPDRLTHLQIGWESVHLLLLDGRPLACTSPLTFLSPAATRLDRSIPNCAWFSGGLFSDPVPSLVGIRLLALREWLVQAQSALLDNPPEEHRGSLAQPARLALLDAVKASSLRTAIAAFIKTIDDAPKSKAAPAGASRITIINPGTYALTGPVQSLLSYEASIVAPGGHDQLKNSSFRLEPSPGAEPVQPILVLSETFCNLPGFNGGNVEVYGGMNLLDALRVYTPANHGILGENQLAPGRIYQAEEIFTDFIFYSEASPVVTNPGVNITPSPAVNTFPGAVTFSGVDKMTVGGGGSMTPLLPLRSDFAAHFTADYLRDNVAFSGDANKIVVSLNIRLNPTGVSNGRPIRISRTYNKDRILTGGVPEVSIWPEYDAEALPGWKTWFLFYDDLKMLQNRLVVSPLPLGATSKSITSTSVTDTTDRNKKISIHECNAFPAKLFCSIERKEVGILLPRGTVRREIPNVELWKIGIDFGTTGSSVFYRTGTPSSLGFPETLRLQPHLLAVSKPSITETYGFFLPSTVENVDGILSVFRDFYPLGVDLEIAPFHDGHISFVDRSEKGLLTGVNADGICANMKWGNSSERARAKAFLKQLCLLTALQAKVAGAHEVEWVFSYPLSFSGDRAGEFELTWSESRRFASLASGYQIVDPKTPPKHYNESICAALFARDRMDAGLRAGALVLDIGGGSSDISVWSGEGSVENVALFNASVKLGGRDIFQRPLLRGKPALLQMLVTGETDREYVKKISAMTDETLGFSKIDSLFKRDSDNVEATQRILTKLDTHSKELDTIAFCKLIGLGLQGLFYYAGLLLRQKQAAAPAGKKLLDGFLPDVYVCGNGSKIFAWLGSGSFSTDAQKRLLKAFAAGAGADFVMRPTTKIALSPSPKSEAAYGMLVAGGSESFDSQHIISGEAFRYRDKDFAMTDVIPYDTLDGTASFTIPQDMPGLSQALPQMGVPPLAPGIATSVRSGVNERLAAIAKARQSTAVAAHEWREEEQPIFIMQLVELIRCATVDWKEGKPAWW